MKQSFGSDKVFKRGYFTGMIPGVKFIEGGDARFPLENKVVIVHIVNNEGKWGAGFTGALSETRPQAEKAYRGWFSGNVPNEEAFNMGSVQYVNVTQEMDVVAEKEVWVVNMVAQNGIKKKGDPPGKIYVDYNHLYRALMKVYGFCHLHGYSIHMPKIGCGHGGGNWERIEEIIGDCLRSYYVRTFVYVPHQCNSVKCEIPDSEVGW